MGSHPETGSDPPIGSDRESGRDTTSHQGEHCPISPSVRDLMVENANVMGQNRPPTDA